MGGDRLRKNPINGLMRRNRDRIHIHSKPLYQSLGDNSFFFFLKTKVIPSNFINPSASQIYPRLQTTQIYPRLSSPQKPDSKIFILKNSYTFQIFLHNVLFILLFLNILNQLLSGSNFTPGGCIFLYLDEETIHFEYPSRPRHNHFSTSATLMTFKSKDLFFQSF